MPETTPERIYKHKVPADVFVEAFTTVDWTEEQTKRFNELGIERLKGSELNEYHPSISISDFNNNKNYTLLKNGEIINDIIIKNNQTLLPDWVLYQCKLCSVILSKCIWDGTHKESSTNFNIENSIIDTFNIESSYLGNLQVKTKSKINYFEVDANSNLGSFFISDSDAGGFQIQNSIIGDFTVWFNSSIDNFEVNSNSIIGNINVLHQSVAKDFLIFSSIIGVFVVSRSTIGKLYVGEASNTGSFNIENSTTGDLSIWGNSTTGHLNIKNSKSSLLEMVGVYTFIFLDKAVIGQCKLNHCYISELMVNNECAIELYVSHGAILHINFKKLTLGKNSLVSFSNTAVYACNMNEFVMLGNLYFRDIKKLFNSFIWTRRYDGLTELLSNEESKKNTKNESVMSQLIKQKNDFTNFYGKLTKDFPTSTFRITQASLGKTEFTECDLAAFNFEFNNSKITEVFISGGTLPDIITKKIDNYHISKIVKLHQQKSFFDQLKKVFEGQGDIVRATLYHAKASEIQMQIIAKEKFKQWYKYFDTEWLVYKLNEISNRHGESWAKAFWFTVGISLIGFIFYNAALEPREYEFVWAWNTDYIGDWAQFILPIHRTDFMVDKPSSFANFIDVVFRIFIGYGIYQLISAFRKHGKKG